MESSESQGVPASAIVWHMPQQLRPHAPHGICLYSCALMPLTAYAFTAAPSCLLRCALLAAPLNMCSAMLSCCAGHWRQDGGAAGRACEAVEGQGYLADTAAKGGRPCADAQYPRMHRLILVHRPCTHAARPSSQGHCTHMLVMWHVQYPAPSSKGCK